MPDTAPTWFPVLGQPVAVRWSRVAPHEAQAERNHRQSLKTLASRGGLSWCELLAVLEDRPWRGMLASEAREKVLEIING